MSEQDMKRCSKGDSCVHPNGPVLPATAEYFSRDKSTKDGLGFHCKKCRKEYRRRYYVDNKQKVAEATRRWRADNPEKARESSRRWNDENPERARNNKRRWRLKNIEKVREIKRRYREAPEKARERTRQWIAKNPERARESVHRWQKENPEKARERKHRRDARKLNLPNTFTAAREQAALDYFHGYCAVCGEPLRDLFGERKPHMDHWIPLSDPRPDNPGYTPGNMVPLCSKCNLSKSAADPHEWLVRKFGERKAKQIEARIEQYFAWVKENAQV